MECRELTERALGLLTGELEEPDRRELDEHCAACAACRRELGRLEATWSALGSDPDAEVTPELRRRTLALLEEEMTRQRIRDFRPRPRWTVHAAQAAAVLLAAGIGWLAHQPAAPARAGHAGGPAGQPVSPEPVSGAVSNVSYRPADVQGKVAVSFDVTSRRTVVGRPEDPAVANLVAYLVSRGAQTSGERAQAIDLVSSHYGAASGAVSPEIVRALTATLKRDQNPGVRKKAADALAGFPFTPEIRTAFLDALQNDRNPAVRLVAVEALSSAARQSPDPRTIESLREKASDPSENGFVRAKAASALKAMEF
jgi:anti-sigma factor RsiW